MSDEIPTMEDLRLLRVVDLKKYLVDFGLATTGNKPDLVQRLFEYYEQQKADKAGTTDEPMEQDEDEAPAESELTAAPVIAAPVVEAKGDSLTSSAEIHEKAAEKETGHEATPLAAEVVSAPPPLAPSKQQEESEASAAHSEAKKETGQKLSLQFGPPKAHPAGAPPVEDVAPAATRAERSPVKVAASPEKAAPSPVKAAPSPVKAAPSPVKAAPSPIKAAPLSPVKAAPSPVKAAPLSPVKAAPLPVTAATLSPVKAAASPVIVATPPVKAVPPPVKAATPSPTPAPKPSPAPKVEVKTAAPVKKEPPRVAAPPVRLPVRAPVKQAVYEEEEEDEDMDDTTGEEIGNNKEKRNKKKLKKKKKKNRPEMWAMQAVEAHRRRMEEAQAIKSEQDVEVEYIQEDLALDPSDPLFRTFSKIFQAFKISEPVPEVVPEEKEEEERKHAEEFKKVPKLLEDDDLIEEKEDDGEPKISKRKLKKQNRLSVAELKQLVSRPDVVEMHDVTARDPRLLVHLKSTRNTVPVPRHWCFKRKYLQGKRGIEKPPFDLPDFIKKTGIMEMREALQEKEDAKGMKAKQREKVRPKLGKIDIDYQKLHDAFFKWQTKPRMTMHGDLYYEGKEFEIRLKEKKPGDLTDDLRTALGMPVGPNAHKVPPPWLIAMQRYGPPPSYPNLKIPGLNAPIPDGCSFGYHAGGWGKPPVDEVGKPLYGDVFGTSDTRALNAAPTEEIDATLWGEMESESEEETDSEDEEEEEEGGDGGEETGLQTPVVGDGGMATPSGTTSTIGGAGLETPDMIELRKRRIEADMEGGETPSLPYTILPERRNERIGASMMGSAHTYDLGKARAGGGGGGAKGRDTAVEMALDPEEIDFDSETMALKAEAALREQQANLAKEDLSDMVAEHAAKQKSKRKRQEVKDEKEKAKKYKEFKF